MDPSEIDELVRRLVINPHDEEALAYAHQQGAADPKSYALLLERVGSESEDAAYASHWLSEAANIWITTLGDAHRAARVLMQAIDRDPTQRVAADRLAQLYRDKGDVKALVALLERRAKALAPLASDNPEIKTELATMHEELGRLWAESLAQPKKALENYRRSIDLDPQSAYAIYGAREIYKSQGSFGEAFQMYEAELAIEKDPARQLALLRDESATRRSAGDLAGVSAVLAKARQLDPEDPALQQEYASSLVERVQAGENVPQGERQQGAEILVNLAEQYDGEHGLAYSGGALDIEPGHERAMQLYVYYARALGREDDNLSARYLAYVQSNPSGEMSAEARHILAASFEAAGQFQNAIEMLEPLREDPDAANKLRELYPQAAAKPQTAPLVSTTPREAPEAPARASDVGNAPSRRGGALAPDKLQGILDAAQMLANKGKKPEAFQKYKEVLETDAAHPEALSWVEDYLRTKRDYTQLRDVLLAAVRVMSGDSTESRKERLREVAGLCEGNLRDTDGAINAWKQLLSIDRSDEVARQSLTRLLEKAQRWDDLANLLEQEAIAETDLEKKIALEKKLATMQETKRRDYAAAAEAWGRIADLTPEDERAIGTASKMFEKAQNLQRAAEVIAEHAQQVTDPSSRGGLLERLGELREQLSDVAGAGEAYAEAAEVLQSSKLWEAAERCFVGAERWERAAHVADQRVHIVSDAKQQAAHFARAAEHLGKAGDQDGVIQRLEQATDLDPSTEEYTTLLSERYTAQTQWGKLAELLTKRAARLTDKAKRIAVRRQAANLYATQLQDKEATRDMWLKVLEDGDDKEALEKLIDDAIERNDHTEATTLLRRLANTATDKAEKARVALREAELLAEGVGDVEMAISRYEAILADLDPTCRPALQAIADLQEARENPGAAADALERELKLVADVEERGSIAGRLARLYERLDDAKNAIRALDIVRKADLEDFDALARLCELCEKTEQWDRVAELLAQRIEVEADEAEASVMTKKLAEILADKLDRGDEALAALTELADQGDPNIRQAYTDLGDKLGWKGIVATKIVEWWFEARHGVERTANLRGAFERFSDVGRDGDAVRVAVEIIRSKGADKDLAERLETLAIKTSDQDALAIAHDLLARELSGAERARELVRQAEARVKGGAPRVEAMQHGEAGLTSVPAGEAEPLLERLALLAEKPNDVIDIYERQISRSKAPADRTRALARAAQVASARGQLDRARGFFELALAGTPTDDTLSVLETAARDGDEKGGGEKLRRALCAAMSSGGQGARDGGRTRGSLLRRAASMAHRDLRDVEQAFVWLGDALIAHVDGLTLDTLEGLGIEVNDGARAEATLTRALSEVFDGPLVRQLLARRAKIRRTHLGDKPGAAADLKKLHDLSPNDHEVMEDLSALLTELGDYRGMVQLYEDQILRGKDMGARAELARKVARMWEEQLQDPREAADAWRRVLRMKKDDTEAAQGLERAKANMLKKPDPNASGQYAPPKVGAELPPSASMKAASTAPPSSHPKAAASVVPPPPETHKEELKKDDHELAPTATEAPEDDATGPQQPGAIASTPEPETTRPERPRDLFFRSSPDEVTLSAPTPSGPTPTRIEPESARPTERSAALPAEPPPSIADAITANASPYGATAGLGPDHTLETTEAKDGAEDFSKTGEGTALDFLDATLSRSRENNPEASDEVLIADDLVDLVDPDEDAEGENHHATPPDHGDTLTGRTPTDDKKPQKRSIPPPIPRG